VFVLVQHTAKAITSVDVQTGEPVRGGDRLGQRGEWPGVRDALMGRVRVVEDLVLAQRVQQMPLVPDQGAVQQFAAAGPHPSVP
jgi:hypothetical protein